MVRRSSSDSTTARAVGGALARHRAVAVPGGADAERGGAAPVARRPNWCGVRWSTPMSLHVLDGGRQLACRGSSQARGRAARRWRRRGPAWRRDFDALPQRRARQACVSEGLRTAVAPGTAPPQQAAVARRQLEERTGSSEQVPAERRRGRRASVVGDAPGRSRPTGSTLTEPRNGVPALTSRAMRALPP